MKPWSIRRRCLAGTAVLLAAVVIAAAALAATADFGLGRRLLISYFAARINHPLQVHGALHAQLFSLAPRVSAEGVTIGNPAWMPAGRMAEIGKLTLVLRLPWWRHLSGIAELDMDAATLFLSRDAMGRANWQLFNPAEHRLVRNSAIIRSLSVPNAHVLLEDELHHLHFLGTVTASDPSGPAPAGRMRIVGVGQLNDRPASFEVTADPLATASHRIPYRFTYSEQSGRSHLEGRGALPQPFNFDLIDAQFDAAGPDLRDLYYLTGVHLIDTGDYRLSGKLSRRAPQTRFYDLAATTGASDMRGSVSINSANGRPNLDIELNSALLRLADLGLRAAGRTAEPPSPLLLSDATLSPNVLRIGEAAVNFHADRVAVGRLPLEGVSLKATIDHGVLALTPLTAKVFGGHVTAHLLMDARRDIPAASVDLQVTDLRLGALARKDSDHPPVEGLLQARLHVSGDGSSVHQVAASANGTLSAQFQNGAIRESFAELTGIDLRGLGLLLTKNKQDSAVRCAVARFQAHDGTLSAQSLVADTDSVLITGEGQIHLDSEALDLDIRGHPKGVRLFRLHAPIGIRGNLVHPSFAIQSGSSKLAIIDAGKAKDADCAALLAAADSVEARVPPDHFRSR
jgi:AsmA family protein